MRILVGTLHTIENELPECLAAIASQGYHTFEHFVIEGLPKRDAHKALYDTFMRRANEVDLFIKVDADMVLARRSLFSEIAGEFRADRELARLTILVHDFFSDSLIQGLSSFRSGVKWNVGSEVVFTDRTMVTGGVERVDSTLLAPAAYHCSNPSAFQSFHYGIHRGVKVIEGYERFGGRRDGNLRKIDDAWANFLKRRDHRVGLACLGAELALNRVFGPDHLDYECRATRRILEQYEAVPTKRLRRIVRRLRLRNWGFLRRQWRYELLGAGLAGFVAARLRRKRAADRVAQFDG